MESAYPKSLRAVAKWQPLGRRFKFRPVKTAGGEIVLDIRRRNGKPLNRKDKQEVAWTILAELKPLRDLLKNFFGKAFVYGTLRVLPTEPWIEIPAFPYDLHHEFRSKKSLQNVSEGGKARAAQYKEKRDERERLAQDIWHRRPSLSIRQVAKYIAKQTGDNFETIRKIIAPLKLTKVRAVS